MSKSLPASHYVGQQYGARGLENGLGLANGSTNSLASYSSKLAQRSKTVLEALQHHLPHKQLLKVFTLSEQELPWLKEKGCKFLAYFGLAEHVDTSPKSLVDVMLNVGPVIGDQISCLQNDLLDIDRQINKTQQCYDDIHKQFGDEIDYFQQAAGSLKRLDADTPGLGKTLSELERSCAELEDDDPNLRHMLFEVSSLRVKHASNGLRREQLHCAVGRHKMAFNRAQEDLVQLEIDRGCLDSLKQMGTYMIDDLGRIQTLVPLTYQGLCAGQRFLDEASRATTKMEFGDKLGYFITKINETGAQGLPLPEYSGRFGKHDVRS